MKASFKASKYIGRVICQNRMVLIDGEARSRLEEIALKLNWEKKTDGQFEIPFFQPKDERERICLPHFLTFAAKVHKSLGSTERLFFLTGFNLVYQWEDLGEQVGEQMGGQLEKQKNGRDEPDAVLYLLGDWEPLKPMVSPVKPLSGGASSIKFDVDLSKEEFIQKVEIARDLFSKGELMEVVLSREFSAPFFGNAKEFFEVYRSICPSPYEFLVEDRDFSLVGCSPETMVRVLDREVILRPISGTVRTQDEIPYLLSSPKEKAELDMLIDLGRNDVSRVCIPGVRVEDYRALLRLSNVIHTYATVRGTLRKEFEPFHALTSVLNAGTLSGAPKLAAMEVISKLEPRPRGFYGGSVGVALPDGDLDSAITIRSAIIKNNQIHFRVGATLLHASEPEREYLETEHKARALSTAYGLFKNEAL